MCRLTSKWQSRSGVHPRTTGEKVTQINRDILSTDAKLLGRDIKDSDAYPKQREFALHDERRAWIPPLVNEVHPAEAVAAANGSTVGFREFGILSRKHKNPLLKFLRKRLQPGGFGGSLIKSIYLFVQLLVGPATLTLLEINQATHDDPQQHEHPDGDRSGHRYCRWV